MYKSLGKACLKKKNSKKNVAANGKPTRACLYLRVSTKEQTKNFSLETQFKACTDLCEENDWEIAGTFRDEGESAKTTDRPEFQKMIDFATKKSNGIGYVVVYNVSRFARNNEDHVAVRAILRKAGATLRSVTEPIDDTPEGRLMEGISSVVAQYDNDQKARRTRQGMLQRLQKGQWTHQAPLGYVKVGEREAATLRPDPDKGPLVRKAFELMATGLHTEKQVLETITSDGLRTKKDQRLGLSMLNKMLRNRIYEGVMEVEGFGTFPGKFEPLVGRELFANVQAVLDGRRPTVVPHDRNNPDYPLRRFIRCGKCDSPLTGSAPKGRNGTPYPRYHCFRCGAVSVPKQHMETLFLEGLRKLRANSDVFPLFADIVTDVCATRNADAQRVAIKLTKDLAALRERQVRLVDLYADGKLSESMYALRIEALEDEVEKLEAELDRASRHLVEPAGALAFGKELMGNAGPLWRASKLADRQRLQLAIYPKGLVFDGESLGTTGSSWLFSNFAELCVADNRMACRSRRLSNGHPLLVLPGTC
jgi:site-specific DNA recombinase